MNRTKKEALKKHNAEREGLTAQEIATLDAKDDLAVKVGEKTMQLHNILFSEEGDFHYDSVMEAGQRHRGINPMSTGYIERIRLRRAAMGIKPLTVSGMAQSDDSLELCQFVARKMVAGTFKSQILYLDMDNVLVDFPSGIAQLSETTRKSYEGRLDEVPGIFSTMTPVKGAIHAVVKLAVLYNTYILSTAPWLNPSAWSDKLLWIQQYLPEVGYKRLILSHNKQLNQGHYLVDDRTKNGADQFQGELIQFLTPGYPTWDEVFDRLIIDFVRQHLDAMRIQEN